MKGFERHGRGFADALADLRSEYMTFDAVQKRQQALQEEAEAMAKAFADLQREIDRLKEEQKR